MLLLFSLAAIIAVGQCAQVMLAPSLHMLRSCSYLSPPATEACLPQ
jgi:hypothetical protein